MRCTLDFPDARGRTRRRVFDDPVAVLRADSLDEVVSVIRAVEHAARAGRTCVGWLAYEAAPAFEPACHVRDGDGPLALFGVYTRARDDDAPPHEPARFHPDAAELSADDFAAVVAQVHEAILAGETYQVNLTQRLSGRVTGSARALYEAMRRAQGHGYHALIEWADRAIVSASPELFFERRGDLLSARPMKGTRARGRWLEEDDALAAELLASDKERAENLMIVDLIRNDLGRVAQYGTVEVPSLFRIERFPTVLQMTSTIQAVARADVALVDVLRALFPCGSVTGAPKVRTMEWIARLERSPRGVYCGAIGVVEAGGDATFNVPIRTVELDTSTGAARYGVGSGITIDATAAAEHDEMTAKAAVLTETWPEFALIETLRLEAGAVPRLERHLHRLADSARYFDRPCDVGAYRRALLAAARQHPVGVHRLRLCIAADGTPEVTVQPFRDEATDIARVACLPDAVRSSDRFLFHKTTNRGSYERALARFPDAFDVLLGNEDGLITEFTRGNVVLEVDGRRLTPARGGGLLAGCLRAELMAAGVLEEAELEWAALERADRVWFINSLRGWIEVLPYGLPVDAQRR